MFGAVEQSRPQSVRDLDEPCPGLCECDVGRLDGGVEGRLVTGEGAAVDLPVLEIGDRERRPGSDRGI